MVSEELKNIIGRIKKQGKMYFIEGATEEQIISFESKNGISFPLQYREWLEFSDGGEFFLPAGVQLYGVAHKPLIDINDNDRPNEEYVVIGSLAFGDPILYKKEEEQIVIYNHEADRIEEDEIYQNFYAFLNDLYELLGIGE
ncbi:MAG: SMI1/KNR4 family protein [Lachnospiraceae bacterium]|nr:SMI1/KNR4 family protein [uncultured Schaedlerella sp.]MCI8674829.1 SMI1/KNR4 family protein [Lachnospiraceae bacterium]